MNLFVLGRSRSGKSPFAAQVALALSATHISASAWVRRRFPKGEYPDRAALVEALTRFSVAELRRNPRACVEFIRSEYDLTRPSVLEGLRNPHDFVHLFDPTRDGVAVLEHTANDLVPTAFEGGLDVIARYLAYLETSGMMDPGRVRRYRFPEFYAKVGVVPAPVAPDAAGVCEVSSLDAAILDCIAWCRSRTEPAASADSSPPRPRRVHHEVPPLKTFLRGEYLYDMDLRHVGETVPCTVFAVSSYPGSAPTFQVLLADGSVFSYVPPTALIDPSAAGPAYGLDDLVYHNCPDGDVCVHVFAELSAEPVQAFLRKRNEWVEGRYLFTMDWYEGNDLLHGVALTNGQCAFLPNHKLKFRGGAREFAPYRKLHAEWKVPEPASDADGGKPE